MRNYKTNRTFFFILSALLLLGLSASACLAQEAEKVVRITAKKFEFTPNQITLKKGVPVVLEFVTQDVSHGFSCPELKLQSDIKPGKTATLRFTPDKTGTFAFHCDDFCGIGHTKMKGSIVVAP